MHAITFKQNKRRKIMAGINLTAIIIIIFLCMNTYNNAAGVYSKEINTIMIFPKDYSTGSQFFTAAHEIGHYVYFQKLSHEDRVEYEKLFADTNDFVSNYSKTNASENFAEEFAYATTCRFDPRYVSDTRREYFEKNYEKMMRYYDD